MAKLEIRSGRSPQPAPEDRTMTTETLSPFGFASIAALSMAFLMSTAPAALADGSDGMGTQAAAEMVRQSAIHSGSGWQNGLPMLTTTGTGYSVSYTGTPSSDAGRGPLVIVGNIDGNPIVEYGSGSTPSTMLAMQR